MCKQFINFRNNQCDFSCKMGIYLKFHESNFKSFEHAMIKTNKYKKKYYRIYQFSMYMFILWIETERLLNISLLVKADQLISIFFNHQTFEMKSIRRDSTSKDMPYISKWNFDVKAWILWEEDFYSFFSKEM